MELPQKKSHRGPQYISALCVVGSVTFTIYEGISVSSYTPVLEQESCDQESLIICFNGILFMD
jgi:hypothetical protein